MHGTHTAVVKEGAGWWIDWVEEFPGVNRHEATHEGLLDSLRENLSEALKFSSAEALGAAGENYEELEFVV